MDATMEQPVISDQPLRTGRGWLWLLAALALTTAVHVPSLGLGFVDDDFEWWLETMRRMEDPLRLTSPYGGLRLTNPVLLMPDLVVWEDWIPGWHLTNLTFHAGVMALFFLIARRLGLPAPAAAVLVVVWGVSPYTAFQVREIHPRHDPLLLACWIGIGLLWPGPGERWNLRRAAAAGALALVSALTKETWVVTPGLAAAYESAIGRGSLSRIARTAALWSVGPIVYVAAYLVWPPISATYAAGYYGGGLGAAAKIPSTFAAFCGISELDVTSLRFSPVEWLSVAVLVGLVALGTRTRDPMLVVGLALFLLPFAPVAPVGIMVARYAYVPFAGFLLMIFGVARVAADRAATPRWRLWILGLAGAVVLAIAVASLSEVRGEMADAERRDEGHRRLLDEARLFWGQMPRDRPLVCVRLERTSVNSEVLNVAEGLPKAYYERANYPYGLVRWAELMSWSGWLRGGPLWEEVDWNSVEPGPFAVIGHVDGRFVRLPTDAPTAASAAVSWANRGFAVRLIRPKSIE
jgi:hypothetical protein